MQTAAEGGLRTRAFRIPRQPETARTQTSVSPKRGSGFGLPQICILRTLQNPRFGHISSPYASLIIRTLGGALALNGAQI
jgi:hypothetical protein